ncbi:MerR family transcriptional regulator [Limosilactobacillus difficilis]|uniref:MerR family transcriptional regulator n=1 Tax=Limosilactobacillus difficilis TaxID=2991838 RepID=UPI0024BA05A0|nr:MerR family transcriptional regulator [Limosilactobacillus difficilis]
MKEVSQIMGLSAYTLRYYEKIGLLSFVKRDQNGIRHFSTSDLLTLNTIYRLKETGMSLSEIKHYLKLVSEGIDSVSERKVIMEQHREKIKQQMEELRKALVTIDAKVKYYQTAEKEGSLGVCHDERDEFVQKILNNQL